MGLEPIAGDSTDDAEAVAPAAVPDDAALPFPFDVQHFRWLILGLVLAIVTVALIYRNDLADAEDLVRRLGYPAIFTLSLVGAGGLVIPLPSTLAVFIGGDLLNPIFVGLLAGVGEAVGEITGYALGYSGQGVIDKSRLYNRFERWVRKRGALVIFIVSVIPNPVFDVLGIAAGALRYPLRRFLFIAWAGKTIKNVGIAYAGAQSVTWIKDLFT